MADYYQNPYSHPHASHHAVWQMPVAPTVITQPHAGETRRDARDKVQLGTRLLWLVGIAAIVAAIIAGIYLATMFTALAATPSEMALLFAVAIGMSLSLCGLPVAEAALSRNYPVEARTARYCWLAVFAIAAVAGIFASISAAPSPVTRTADRERLADRLMPDAVWDYSQGCTAPENAYQARFCNEFSRRAGALDAGARPASRAVAALVSLAVVAGAGLLLKLFMLSTAEAVRFQGGEAQPASQVAAGAPPEMAAPPISPMEVFDLWFNSRVRIDPAGRLPALGAFQDYESMCRLNGFAAGTQTAFGRLLNAKAQNSGGRIRRFRTNGAFFYEGLSFNGDSGVIDMQVASDGSFSAGPDRT